MSDISHLTVAIVIGQLGSNDFHGVHLTVDLALIFVNGRLAKGYAVNEIANMLLLLAIGAEFDNWPRLPALLRYCSHCSD